MGLDIYLTRYNNLKSTLEKEKRYTELSEKSWKEAGEYNSLTEEQKTLLREKDLKLSNSMGLDSYGEDVSAKETIEKDSSLYPDHYFKVGYFRSSYNEGGINRILKNLGLKTLNEIFENSNDEYIFKPNWEKALINVNDVLNEFRKKEPYRVHKVSQIFSEPKVTSEKDALDLFINEIEKHKNCDYNYGNSLGDFSYHEPIKVLAMIYGKEEFLGRRANCIYVITNSTNEWYIQALEIVKETIEYVISNENTDQLYLRWSG